MSDCLPPDELQQFLAGLLPPEREAAASDHFDQCEQCQQRADEATDWESIDACRAAISCGETPADVDQQLEPVVSTLHQLPVPVSEPSANREGIVPLPRTIGPYRVLRLLAQGSTGSVYLVTSTDDETHAAPQRVVTDPGDFVAAKVLTPECVDRPLHRKRFERERNALVELPPHPNVVRVLDSCLSDETRYLVMEYAGGRNLWQLVANQPPMTVERACRLTLQAAEGLQHIHTHGLIHRDIKPSNLIIDDHGHLKIVDFGIVHHAEVDQTGSRLTEPNALIGTADFMAPEQAADIHSVGPKSDIYSLGCTLAWLLTGELVFERKTLSDTLVAHRRETIPSLRERRADIPPELDALFQKMVAKQPEDRPQNVAEVIAGLNAILSKPGDTETPPSGPPSPGHALSLRAAVLSLIILGSFAALAAIMAR